MSSIRTNKTLGRVVGAAACVALPPSTVSIKRTNPNLMPEMLADCGGFVHPRDVWWCRASSHSAPAHGDAPDLGEMKALSAKGLAGLECAARVVPERLKLPSAPDSHWPTCVLLFRR